MPVKFNTGGGVAASKDTATVNDVRDGKTFHAGKGGKAKIGAILDCLIKKISPGKDAQTIPAGSYIAEDIVIEGADGLVPENIKSGVTIFGVTGDGNISDTSDGNLEAGKMLSGQVGYSQGQKVTGTIKTLTDADFSPADSSAYNDCAITGKATNSYVGAFDYKVDGYIPGSIRIHIANLLAANIRGGVKIGGIAGYIEGTFTNDATASAADVLSGKTFGKSGAMATGTLKNCGQYQYAGGVGSGTLNSVPYIAFNKIPEGAYFANGATSWAPEIRYPQASLASALGITGAVLMPGKTVCGVASTVTCNSILNFSVEVYNRKSRQVKLKWQNPYASTGKPYAGVFVNYATGSAPGTGGTRIYTGYGSSKVGGEWSEAIVTMPKYGTFYFSCTSYVTFTVNGSSTSSYGTTKNSGAVTLTYSCSSDDGDSCDSSCDCGGDGGNCDSSSCCQGG